MSPFISIYLWFDYLCCLFLFVYHVVGSAGDLHCLGMLFDKRVYMSHAFLFEDFIYGNENASFLNVAETVVDGSAEEFHRWTKAHVGIHKWRDVVAEIAYLAVENLVIFLEGLLAEENLKFFRVSLNLQRVHWDDEVLLVLKVFFEEIQYHVSPFADVRGIHGHLAEEVFHVGLYYGEGAKSVPKIVEREE